jgi:hypothetical protein
MPGSTWTTGPDGRLRYWSETQGQWIYADSGALGGGFGGEVGPADGSGEIIDNIRYLFPGWPDVLLHMFVEEWVETGDQGLALARVRASDAYDAAFPGIRREDGSLRFANEAQYLLGRERFNEALQDVGVNPELFGETFVALLEDNVSIAEATQRIDLIYNQVLDFAPEIIAYYGQTAGDNPALQTIAGIVASALDPNIGLDILERRVGIAQIGGEAAIRDFDIDLGLATRLYEVGITRGEASAAFGDAASVVPVLNTLARRHDDPDDDFDINEFVSAQLLDDPAERRRMRRLLTQERSLFSDVGALTSNRLGAVTGLVQR